MLRHRGGQRRTGGIAPGKGKAIESPQRAQLAVPETRDRDQRRPGRHGPERVRPRFTSTSPEAFDRTTSRCAPRWQSASPGIACRPRTRRPLVTVS
ncbi:MAG: hypothetical protein MZV63_55880 [Marinilabiliales bacterium]|nr:hypothetical protein [Marinilabiliales bacterium]